MTYLVLRIAVVLSLVSACLRGDVESVFICVLVLVLFMIPGFIQKNFGIEMPSALEIIILCFIFAAEIMGELQCFFIKYQHWDTMLHTTNGFICAAVGFSLIDILNRNRKADMKLSPFFVVLFGFCFSMTIGVLWEFFEFFSDCFLHTDMQKDTVIHLISSVALDKTNSNVPVIISGITNTAVNGQELGLGGYLDIGLFDTMEDLLVNFIGAVVFSIFGYYYLKGRDKARFVGDLLIRMKDDGEPPEKPAEAIPAEVGTGPGESNDTAGKTV